MLRVFLDVSFGSCFHFEAFVLVHELSWSYAFSWAWKTAFSDIVLLSKVFIFTISASTVMNLSLIQNSILSDLQSTSGLASDSHELPTIISYAIQSTMYGRTALVASPICIKWFLLHCCIATSVASQSSAFRLLSSLWSFKLFANCFAATVYSYPLLIKILHGK